MTHYIESYHVTSWYFIICHVISCYIVSFHILRFRFILYVTIWHNTVWDGEYFVTYFPTPRCPSLNPTPVVCTCHIFIPHSPFFIVQFSLFIIFTNIICPVFWIAVHREHPCGGKTVLHESRIPYVTTMLSLRCHYACCNCLPITLSLSPTLVRFHILSSYVLPLRLDLLCLASLCLFSPWLDSTLSTPRGPQILTSPTPPLLCSPWPLHSSLFITLLPPSSPSPPHPTLFSIPSPHLPLHSYSPPFLSSLPLLLHS